MHQDESNDSVLALQVIGFLCADPARAQRFLALTGLEPNQLRARLDDPALHAGALAVLAGHEPDLRACADALDLPIEVLASAARRATGEPDA